LLNIYESSGWIRLTVLYIFFYFFYFFFTKKLALTLFAKKNWKCSTRRLLDWTLFEITTSHCISKWEDDEGIIVIRYGLSYEEMLGRKILAKNPKIISFITLSRWSMYVDLWLLEYHYIFYLRKPHCLLPHRLDQVNQNLSL
jgi:hypothetical protein